MQELTEDRVVAIDGKTLRGSADHEAGRAAIHMVSAWATENKLSLGQVVVAEKSNEITAIPNLLDLLEIAGALVSIDAMGCQRDIAGKIRDRKADYILAVKQNQPTLYQRVGAAIAEALEGDAEALDEHETVEKGHGRRETQELAVVAAPEEVDPEGARTLAPWESRSRSGWNRVDGRATKSATIPQAAISETSSNSWKLSVISVFSCSACTVGRPSMVSWMVA